MSPKIEKMRDYCVGRNALSLPVSFEMVTSATGTFKPSDVADGDSSIQLNIFSDKVNSVQFEAELKKRRAELTRSPDKTMDVLAFEKVLNPEAMLYRVNRIDDAYGSQINFIRGGTYMNASLKSYGGSFLNAEKVLIAFIEKINVGSDEAARPAGFCIGNATVQGDFKEENGSVLFRHSQFFGTSFDIKVDSFRPDESVSLLKRTSGPDSLLTKMDADPVVLRKRDLTVSGMQAQEWLAWFKLGPNGDQKEFAFTLETMRPSPGKLSPSLQLSFETGNATASGTVDPYVMEDKDAIALWDVVVKSIRPGTL